MVIDALVTKMKDIYSPLIEFIEATDDHDAKFKTLIEVLKKNEILENKDEIQLLFRFISKITDDHQRTSDFFDKLEKVFQYLIKDIPTPISYFIPDFTKYNRRMLLLLLEKRFVEPDEIFLNQYLIRKDRSRIWNISYESYIPITYFYYLYPKLKELLDEENQKRIESEISRRYEEDISIFEEKCQLGENDSYICSLIRSDSVEEFVSYVNRTNLSLLTKIKPSVYETHSFLLDKEPTLIEYAAFFGSIQIIQYLKYNNVPLTSSLWLYTIHSNNAELIHFLEENEIKPEKNIEKNKNRSAHSLYINNNNKESFDDVLIESIKCHHNAISNYIKDNFYEQIQSDDENLFFDSFIDTIVNLAAECAKNRGSPVLQPDDISFVIKRKFGDSSISGRYDVQRQPDFIPNEAHLKRLKAIQENAKTAQQATHTDQKHPQ